MYMLRKVRLHNICQHDDFEADVSAGLNAVTGRNGSGKSNLLRAAVYALTGVVDPSWGGQQDLQKSGSASPGWAEAVVSDGVSDTVVRRYSALGSKFPDTVSRDGVAVAVRRRAVDVFMQGVFGLPCALMAQLCWCRQGELASLLTATPANVSLFLSQLFDTRRLERLREKLKLQLDTIPSPSVFSSEQLAKTVSEREAREASLPSLEDAVTSARARHDSLSARLADAEASVPAAVDVDALRRNAGEASRETARLLGLEFDPGEDDLRAIAEAGACLDPAPLEAEVSSMEAELRSVEEAVRLRASDLAHTRRMLEEAVKARDEFRSWVAGHEEAFRPPEDGVCPVCGGTIDPETYPGNVMRLVWRDRSDEDYSTWRDAKERGHAKMVDSLQASADSMQRSLDELSARASSAREFLGARRLVLATAKAAASAARALSLRGDLARLSSADMAVVESLRRETAQAESDLRAAEDGLASCRAAIGTLRAYEEPLRQEAERSDVCGQARQLLSSLRDALSQQRAQRRYLVSKVSALNSRLSRQMEATGMPFSLRLDVETFQFQFRMHDWLDGDWRPAARLSGAQKSMSAVALHMAVLSIMRPEMNLFMVDEPSEALDAGNKRVMADMFARMNAMLPSVSGTALIVTRDQEIVDACGSVIEIGEGR